MFHNGTSMQAKKYGNVFNGQVTNHGIVKFIIKLTGNKRPWIIGYNVRLGMYTRIPFLIDDDEESNN